METENNNVLYMHTRKTDGGIFYIGIGNKKRTKSKRNRSEHWHNTIKKYDYVISILAENLSWERACELEIKMIAFYGRQKPNPKNLNYGCLINQTDGGDGYSGGFAWNKGITPTDEVKSKISNTLKGKLVGEKNPFYKKTHTEESRKKMSEKQKDKVLSEDHKLKIAVGNTGKIVSDETRKKISVSGKGKKKPTISKAFKGSGNPQSKFNEVDIKNIRFNGLNKIMSVSNIAKKYKVGIVCIYNILKYKTYTEVL
jgi:hypothetical protein